MKVFGLEDFCPRFIPALEKHSSDAGSVTICFPPSWLFCPGPENWWISFSSKSAFPSFPFALHTHTLRVAQDSTEREENMPGGRCVLQTSPAEFIHCTHFCTSFRPKGRDSNREQWGGKLYLPTDSNDLTLMCSLGIWHWGVCFSGGVSLQVKFYLPLRDASIL